MASTTRASKGFQVTCPFCGDADATITLELNDLRNCACSSCSAEFSPQAARDKAAAAMARWEAVVRWVEMAAELAAE